MLQSCVLYFNKMETDLPGQMVRCFTALMAPAHKFWLFTAPPGLIAVTSLACLSLKHLKPLLSWGIWEWFSCQCDFPITYFCPCVVTHCPAGFFQVTFFLLRWTIEKLGQTSDANMSTRRSLQISREGNAHSVCF